MVQTNTPALEVENITKRYGTLTALNNVSFSLPKGEVFGLLGPNGAGKTSLISIIVSLEAATAGHTRVFGADVATHPRAAKQNLGWVPQEVINHGFFDVEEILHFQAGYYGVRKPKERIDYVLQSLSLWEHRHKKVKQLSGGMKRRLMIAKALVHDPGLLLLDEPTAGVDMELRHRLWDFVGELKRDGLTILLTTHYLEEAQQLCDRVAIIHQGSMRALDSTQKLIQQWSRKKVTLRLVDEHPRFNHPDLVGGQAREWIFLTSMTKNFGQLLDELHLSSQQIRDVQVQEGSLEDVFMHFTQQEGT